MSMPSPVDLNAAIERIGVGRLALTVIVLCFVMMAADGYDFTTLSVAAPAMLREWQIQPREMGVAFSITFFGLLTGSLIYGWLGDHWGRRPTIIFGTFNFGVPILLTVWATNAIPCIGVVVVGVALGRLYRQHFAAEDPSTASSIVAGTPARGSAEG